MNTNTLLRIGIVCLLSISALLPYTSCKESTTDKPEIRTENNRVIYELFVRNFTEEGTFNAAMNHIDEIRDLGVDVVWIMPMYRMGTAKQWGEFPSPYCIQDFKDVGVEYGSREEFKALVDSIHSAGMDVWMDWIANHTSCDHPWLESHPEYYERKANGDFIHPFDGAWGDVYQLDYSNMDLRREMIESMQYWVTEFDIDGYRCDYADGLPLDFWKEVTSTVKKADGTPIAWLAESRGEYKVLHGDTINQLTYLKDGGFRYNYAWYFRDSLASLANKFDLNTLREECRKLFDGTELGEENSSMYDGKSRLVFLTNHDTNDQQASEVKIFGNRLRPMTVLQFTIYGMPLIYNGQEIGYPEQIHIAFNTPIYRAKGDSTMTTLIKQLTKLKHTEPALRDGNEKGELVDYTTTSDSVLVYERRRGDESVVVMLNFGNTESQFSIAELLPKREYREVFSGERKNFAENDTFRLDGNGYAVWIK